MKNLYTIPLGTPFLKSLAKGLLKDTLESPFELAKYLILLPTQRACLALQKEFVSQAKDRPLFFPRIMALADLENSELLLSTEASDLPPAIPNWQRLGLFTQLILKFYRQQKSISPATASKLALELMSLVDEIETTNLDFNNLKDIVSDNFSAHWQITLNFLQILTTHWPLILAEKGMIEPAKRKRLTALALAKHWQNHPPTHPIIIAGTTGTVPATAELIKTLLSCPNGKVILPGLDKTAKDPVPTHPQYTLTQLLNYLGVEANDVTEWHPDDSNLSTQQFLSVCMGNTIPEIPVDYSFQSIECESIQIEAKVIALIMRHHLETPKKTITLVTPNLELARRVTAELGRWQLIPNTSHGLAIQQSVVGSFLLLTSHLTNEITPSNFLSILKHPLCGKESRAQHIYNVRKLEVDVIRESNKPFKLADIFEVDDSMKEWAQALSESLKPLINLSQNTPLSITTLINAHKRVIEALAAQYAWQQEDGIAAKDFFDQLIANKEMFPSVTAQEYPEFLKSLMSHASPIHSHRGIGSRLSILGALEARLNNADVMIVSGLNEGTWPAGAGVDPWFSQSMRKAFGLPPLERKIGLSGHDFCSTFSASEVYLTRSNSQNGSPTLPSRWWQRVHLFAKSKLESTQWLHWAQQLDATHSLSQKRTLPPCPRPPVAARPKKLSVTAVEKLMRDPYSIYARYILNLKPLNPLQIQLSGANRGQLIHHALDLFAKGNDRTLEALLDCGRKAFRDYSNDPIVYSFWWPRFERIAIYVMENLTTERIVSEAIGEITISVGNIEFNLSAIADRIDLTSEDSLRIIDYKTGSAPSQKDALNGYSPQLPLEGLIASYGGFGNSITNVSDLSFWVLTGGEPAGEIVSLNSAEVIENAEIGFKSLIEAFNDPETPYLACPTPNKAPVYNDYTHLERLWEWMI